MTESFVDKLKAGTYAESVTPEKEVENVNSGEQRDNPEQEDGLQDGERAVRDPDEVGDGEIDPDRQERSEEGLDFEGDDDVAEDDSAAVPASALKAERAKRRKERSARRELENELSELKNKFEAFVSGTRHTAPPQEPVREVERFQPPDKDEDPEGWLLYQIDSVRNENQQIQTAMRVQALETAAAAQTAQFRQVTPDYDSAVQHYFGSEVRRMMVLGYDEQSAVQAVQANTADIAAQIIARGGNVAKALYEQAKLYGYSAPKPQAKTQAPTAREEFRKRRESIIKNSTVGSGDAAPSDHESFRQKYLKAGTVEQARMASKLSKGELDKILKVK